MQLDNYGENYHSHLIDQYKLFVEMADRISARRGQTNSFYISLLSALLALLSLIIDKELVAGPASIVIFFTALIGLALCLTWTVNLQSYRQLNGLKFQVIHEMEALLPFSCYKREWDLLKEKRGSKQKQYIRLTTVERYIPVIFALPYLGLLVYTVLVFIGVIDLPVPTS